MRILRIRMLNLNSLRGEHVIDFTEAPLGHHQLFAIVGKTGAGKTTILDAITLALYGQTERNKKETDRSDGVGSVLSYGEGECAAEVEFETRDGHYRSVWTRQRAHKKAEGALQGSKHRISKIHPDTREQITMLAEKKKQVARITEEVVGLDYERFVRSAMLTQGEFARFLKSDTGDKAAILEKITGTEIYQELSMAAFQRHKQARELLEKAKDALAANPPLLAEERAELETKLNNLQGDLERVTEKRERINAGVLLHEALDKLVLRSAAIEIESAKVEEEWLELSPERYELMNSEAVNDIRQDLDITERLTQELGQLATQLKVLYPEAEKQDKVVLEAMHQLEKARQVFAEFTAKLPERERIFGEAGALEKQVEHTTTEAAGLTVQKTALAEKLKAAEQTITTQTREIEKIDAAFGAVKSDELDQVISSVEHSIAARSSESEQLRIWLDFRQRTDRIDEELAEASKLVEAINAHRESRDELTKSLEDLTKHYEERCEVAKTYRLQRQLKDHRHELVDGRPCPLCGALEHPVLSDWEPVSNDKLIAAEEKEKAAQLAVKKDSAELIAVEVKLENTEIAHAKLLEKVASLRADLANVATPTGENTSSAKEIRTALEQLNEAIAAEGTLLASQKELQASLPRLRELQTLRAGQLLQVRDITSQSGTIDAQLAVKSENITSAKATIGKLLGGDHTSKECRRMTARKEKELTEAVTKSANSLLQREADAKRLREKLDESVAADENKRAELTRVREGMAAHLISKNLTEEQARKQLLSPAAEKLVREKLLDVDNRRNIITARLKDVKEEMQQQRVAVEHLPPAIDLRAAREELDQTISQDTQRVGALHLQVTQDDQRIKNIAEKQTELDLLRKERDRWARLDDLIGSADGKKFRSYAQAITLQRLIDIGNGHLAQISPRYRMEYEAPESGKSEDLNMIIIDQYQNDNKRTMATLSGGESFLISLALALGLSDLASGKSLIRSLFIDEGFGTLDDETLSKAMTTLEGLQAQGKTIGLISHVPQLRERIQCQIVLEPVGDGFSTIRVVG